MLKLVPNDPHTLLQQAIDEATHNALTAGLTEAEVATVLRLSAEEVADTGDDS